MTEPALRLVGYSDRISVAPGETIRFMVSADGLASYEAEIVRLIGRQLAEQQASGREYLVGDALSALDIYWAAFAALIDPLPEEVCPMPMPMRMAYGMKHPELDAAVTPELLAHRTLVYERHLELPIDLGPE